MTISTTVCKITLPGNGDKVTFNYNFELPIGSSWSLIYTAANGTETILSPSVYSVTGIGVPNGGTFTYPLIGSPIATGTSLTFLRQTPYTQATSLVSQTSYSPASVEGGLDWIVYQVQQLAEQASRSIQIPVADPQGLVTTLPPAAQRAGAYAAFDSLGNLITTNSLPSASKAYVDGVSCAVASVAALRLNTSLANAAFVSGFFAPGDGGGGWFSYVSTDTTSADNGGTIIVDALAQRWYRLTDGAAVNVVWFGGLPGVADCTAALNAALGTITSPGGTIYFPRGTYTFASLISYSLPSGEFSIGFEGAGSDATVLYWPSTSGIAINASSALHTVHFRDLSITTGSTTATLTGVLITNSIQGGNIQQSDFFRVTFRGSDGGAGSKVWGCGLSIIGLSFVNYDSCIWYGNVAQAGQGLSVAGLATGAFKYGLVHNLCKCSFFTLGFAFVYGTYIQGVSISQCNFTNNITGVYLPAGIVGACQLTISTSQFAGSGTQILINGACASLILSSNLIFVGAAETGIAINATTGQSNIVGNSFSGMSIANSVGIGVKVSAYSSTIVGNQFYAIGTAVDLSGSPTGWTVQANMYNGCTTNILNPGSNPIDTCPNLGQVINGPAGYGRGLTIQTNGVSRWIIYADNAAETGGNNGSNFELGCYSDTGGYLRTSMSIIRATGQAVFANGVGTIGNVSMVSLPTSPSGLTSGQVWRNGTVLNIV